MNMAPEFLTQLETQTVTVLQQLLELTDLASTADLTNAFSGFLNDAPATRATARHVTLTLHTRETNNEIAPFKSKLKEALESEIDDYKISEQAIGQHAKNQYNKLNEFREQSLGDHALVNYIHTQVGSLGPLSALPEWVQQLLNVRPSPISSAWGTHNDLAQFIGRLACGDRQFSTWSTANGDELWITSSNSSVQNELDNIADTITNGQSAIISRSALIDHLSERREPVSAPQHEYVINALTYNKNIIWIPEAEMFIAFKRHPGEKRNSRGSANDRIKDVAKLLPRVEADRLRDAILREFVAQHNLKPSSVDAAIRASKAF